MEFPQNPHGIPANPNWIPKKIHLEFPKIPIPSLKFVGILREFCRNCEGISREFWWEFRGKFPNNPRELLPPFPTGTIPKLPESRDPGHLDDLLVSVVGFDAFRGQGIPVGSLGHHGEGSAHRLRENTRIWGKNSREKPGTGICRPDHGGSTGTVPKTPDFQAKFQDFQPFPAGDKLGKTPIPFPVPKFLDFLTKSRIFTPKSQIFTSNFPFSRQNPQISPQLFTQDSHFPPQNSRFSPQNSQNDPNFPFFPPKIPISPPKPPKVPGMIPEFPFFPPQNSRFSAPSAWAAAPRGCLWAGAASAPARPPAG